MRIDLQHQLVFWPKTCGALGLVAGLRSLRPLKARQVLPIVHKHLKPASAFSWVKESVEALQHNPKFQYSQSTEPSMRIESNNVGHHYCILLVIMHAFCCQTTMTGVATCAYPCATPVQCPALGQG